MDGSSLADFSTLKMEAIRSPETSVQFTRSTRRHFPEDGILHSHRSENLKFYKVYIVTDLINAFPGNGSVNTVQQATIDEVVFSMYSAPRPLLVTDK
jgi:hypothetical protein